MNKIVAIVVTYNRLNLFRECILNLLKEKNSIDILVIDNNSCDGTRQFVERLKCYNDNIIYHNTGKNIGGAGGFSLGLRMATELGYEYAWVMDDDCIVQKNTLKIFMDFDKKNKGKYGFLSSKVVWKDSSLCTMNVQRKGVYKNIDVNDTKHDVVKIKMASFVSLFLPTKIIRKVGLPIKDFFIWTDDWEYTRRISRYYSCYLLNDSVVVHKCKSNQGANISTADWNMIDRFKYLYRNDVYLYRREGICGWLYQSIRLSYHILKILRLSPNHKIGRINILLKSTIKGIFFKPDIEYLNR
ncbi:glycosyltransferase family 2 protein [Veillonella sp. R32]|uniref:glycosyltransferase family 2 protein n=1 Tax=Veillonella sp. R32 TaxID=2021312 RepID=UPI00138A0D58|nr:glycosyltransferase family 2 protein [Veillonella sp. R32]KAF1680114.1 glycosyl transferase [Veillonella sp. R32]